MSNARPDVLSEQVLHRICAEYVEMPGLRLSRKQAQRLWGIDEEAPQTTQRGLQLTAADRRMRRRSVAA